MPHPVITLLTDFGSTDHYVAAMKGVILGICPGASIVDITHDIKPFAIAEAAYTLAQAWRCFPAGTVHVAVVDPGVGSKRRAVLVEAAGHRFIGPDNGIFTMALDSVGRHEARNITARQYFRKPVSTTFHGRDIFAPVAAHLASGVEAAKFGRNVSRLVRLPAARPVRIAPGRWRGVVLKIDHFGNLITNFPSRDFQSTDKYDLELIVAKQRVRLVTSDYSRSTSEPFMVHGSAGYIEVSLHQGDAGVSLGVNSGISVEILRLARSA